MLVNYKELPSRVTSQDMRHYNNFPCHLDFFTCSFLFLELTPYIFLQLPLSHYSDLWFKKVQPHSPKLSSTLPLFTLFLVLITKWNYVINLFNYSLPHYQEVFPASRSIVNTSYVLKYLWMNEFDWLNFLRTH